MFKDNDFSPDSIKDLHISFETMFTQVPIVVRNSHLMNALLLDIQDQLPRTGGGEILMTRVQSKLYSSQETNIWTLVLPPPWRPS